MITHRHIDKIVHTIATVFVKFYYFLVKMYVIGESFVPIILSMNQYVKYCNFMRKKHVNLELFSIYHNDDVVEFNKIKFHSGVEQLTVKIKNYDPDIPQPPVMIIIPDTIKELNIFGELNYFENYIFNENIETVRYDNWTDTFEKYNAMNNLYVRNYIATQHNKPKIEKIPYGCVSKYCHDVSHFCETKQLFRQLVYG